MRKKSRVLPLEVEQFKATLEGKIKEIAKTVVHGEAAKKRDEFEAQGIDQTKKLCEDLAKEFNEINSSIEHRLAVATKKGTDDELVKLLEANSDYKCKARFYKEKKQVIAEIWTGTEYIPRAELQAAYVKQLAEGNIEWPIQIARHLLESRIALCGCCQREATREYKKYFLPCHCAICAECLEGELFKCKQGNVLQCRKHAIDYPKDFVVAITQHIYRNTIPRYGVHMRCSEQDIERAMNKEKWGDYKKDPNEEKKEARRKERAASLPPSARYLKCGVCQEPQGSIKDRMILINAADAQHICYPCIKKYLERIQRRIDLRKGPALSVDLIIPNTDLRCDKLFFQKVKSIKSSQLRLRPDFKLEQLLQQLEHVLPQSST